MFDEPLDETLSVRPRNQHRRIDKKRAREKLLCTEKVGERDTLRAFFCDVVKFAFFVRRKNSIVVNELSALSIPHTCSSMKLLSIESSELENSHSRTVVKVILLRQEQPAAQPDARS